MSLVLRIIAPTGRDAELIRGVLVQEAVAAEVCPDFGTLMRTHAQEPIGPLLIAQEALRPGLVAQLAELIQRQPTWSDLPILVLTAPKRVTQNMSVLGAPVYLERPIRTETLVSSARAAVRARARQYQVRDALQQRDQALANLRQEQEMLRVVLENMPVGVAFAKSSGEIMLGNRELEAIVRHPVLRSPNIDSHGDWIAFHADGQRVRGVEFPLARAMAEGRVIHPEEYLYQRGDGSKAWVSLTAAPIVDEQGTVTGGVVAMTDVDAQKRSAEKLRLSEERFRRLIEHASVGVLIGDVEGRISYLNPYLQKLLGYSDAEVHSPQFRWDQLTPPEHAAADRQAVTQLKEFGTAEPYQKTLRAKDSRQIPFLIGATVIPSEEKDTVASEVAVFLTDLSSQKQAEVALIQSEKLAAVGRLASSISHEINNPLEAVTNTLYLLGHEELNPTARGYLETATQELNRVSQIAIQTLRFHRQATRPRSVSAEELLEPVLALYHGRLANAGVTVLQRHRGPVSVVCYEGEIRQVLSNLVGNAIDAMRSGGHILLHTGPAHCWETDRTGIYITVADTGQGMSPEVLRRIFEPFYTTKEINGTGLGLWVSEEIVRKHHGSLRVRSRPSAGDAEICGTAFRLFLPATLDA